jgi:hypothetical protein
MPANFINEVPAPPLDGLSFDNGKLLVQRLPLTGRAWLLRNCLPPAVTLALREHGAGHCTRPVGHDGIAAHYAQGDAIGSYRASVYSEAWAQRLWACVPEGLKAPLMFDSSEHSDWDGHPCWQPEAVNPLLRFIRYEPGSGELVAHYDAPYVESTRRKTLLTFLIYLSDNTDEGKTRFLKDPQEALPFEQRNFDDHTSVGKDSDVFLAVSPRAGDALIFEHRLLHDSSPIRLGPEKLVLRTDLICVQR